MVHLAGDLSGIYSSLSTEKKKYIYTYTHAYIHIRWQKFLAGPLQLLETLSTNVPRTDSL